MISRRLLRAAATLVAATLALTGCAAVYDPDAAAPARWVRDPEYTPEVVAAVGQDVATAAWQFATDFAFTHQFREELMDPDAPPTADQLTHPVIDHLTDRAKPYWTDQVTRAVRGDMRAVENLDVLQFSGWEERVEVTMPGSNDLNLTQAIEGGRVDWDADAAEITVRFDYNASFQMSARGHLINFHAVNKPTYWLAQQPGGGFKIDGFEGGLRIR